jgi:hypothetical protein
VDHILYWNNVALEVNRRDFSDVPGVGRPMPEQGGPTLSSRALAITHLAMYDAHAGVVADPSMPAYLPGLSAPGPGASAAAAVAAAAHSCLSALYPRQKPHLDAAHAAAGLLDPGLAAGHSFGLMVARAMLRDRAADPRAGDDGYTGSLQPGAHRPDPASPGQGFHAPFYGSDMKCFAVNARFGLEPPPARDGAEYERAVKQVRGKGIAPDLMGTLPSGARKRTPDQTLVGVFWAYDGARLIGTPPRLYNQIVRNVAVQQANTVDENARLFALVNSALGDAGILAWQQKYLHDLWRPVLGVRENDPSMGPAAPQPTNDIDNDGDPGWLPLGAPTSNGSDPNSTPPFPAYPSGHATFGAAVLHTVRLFYGVPLGDRSPDTLFSGSFVSDELDGTTKDNQGVVRPRHARAFDGGLWQMIEENGFSRVYLGVHWSFDAFALDGDGRPDVSRNIGGVPLGLSIAESVCPDGRASVPVKSTI